MKPGLIVELALDEIPETVFVVAGAAEGKQLALENVPRGRIWTTREIAAMRAGFTSREHARGVAEAKIIFDGRVDEALKR